MTFKKIMLFASLALAAVAFAAPAAQATPPIWTHNGNPITGTQPLHVVGSLASVVGGSISGPCEVTFEGEASNVEGMASGTITGGTIQTECETSKEGCTVTPTLEGFNWNLTGTTVTGQKGVAISGASFINHYMEETPGDCEVPALTLTATGTATGIVDGNGCLSFANHQDDIFLFGVVPVDITGSVCDTTLKLS